MEHKTILQLVKEKVEDAEDFLRSYFHEDPITGIYVEYSMELNECDCEETLFLGMELKDGRTWTFGSDSRVFSYLEPFAILIQRLLMIYPDGEIEGIEWEDWCKVGIEDLYEKCNLEYKWTHEPSEDISEVIHD